MGYLFGGPNNKDFRIWGLILGSPYFGKVPNELQSKLLKADYIGDDIGEYCRGY